MSGPKIKLTRMHEAAGDGDNKHEYPVGDMSVSIYGRMYPQGGGQKTIAYVGVTVPKNGRSRNEWSVPVGPGISAESIKEAVKHAYRRIVAMAFSAALGSASEHQILTSELSLKKFADDEATLLSGLDFDKMAANYKKGADK